MNRILITGGAGFIGWHLATKLREQFEVHVIDNLSNEKSRSNFDLLMKSKVRVYRADVRSKESLAKVIRGAGIDSCVHLAAKIGVSESMMDPYTTMDVNINGTLNVLEACVRNSVKRFVFASSAAVYGNVCSLPIAEDTVLKPMSPYGASKAAAEMIFNAYANLQLFDSAIVLRFFNVYGRGQSEPNGGVITKFRERISQNLPPIIYGDGSQQRDFISVHDVVESILHALEPRQSSSKGIYNIATGVPTSIIELSVQVASILNKTAKPTFHKKIDGDIQNSYADINKARSELDFVPKMHLEKGLKEYLDDP